MALSLNTLADSQLVDQNACMRLRNYVSDNIHVLVIVARRIVL